MMKWLNCLPGILFFLAAPLQVFPQARIENLRTEYLNEPLGIDNPAPRFTWIAVSDKPFTQRRALLRVATSAESLRRGDPDVWNGERQGKDNLLVYAGPSLRSHTRYWWDVTVWDERGRKTTSAPAWFETAKMSPQEWDAVWISDEFTQEFRKAPMLRREFSTEKEICRARAYVCGIGYYELFVNGGRVGDRWLDPGYTHFDKRVLYSTYDITELLRRGDNAVAAVLGNGWLNIQSLAVWDFHLSRWRMRPRLLCEIRIEYADGTAETIATGPDWRVNTGPYIYNCLYSGDTYDARLEKPGWDSPGYDDSAWDRATVVEAPAPAVAAQQMEPIRITDEIRPVGMRTFPGSVRVYDLGRNMSGLCRLKVKGEAGTRITLKHGELLHPDGRLDQGNIDIYFQRIKNGRPVHADPTDVFQTDTYYLKGGGGEEVWTPSFCYHGFRYVEVESDKPVELDMESITGLFIHTDVKPAGRFRCSDKILNQIHEAACHTYLSNLHGIPTDCPQREKNGWTADGYISMELGLLNYDGITVYEKWLNDFVDNQRRQGDISGIIPSSGWGYADWIGPVWDAGLFIIPYTLYLYYGDTNAIGKIWDTAVRYLAYLETREKDGILTYGIGDWVYHKAVTDNTFTSTAFYYADYALMAEFARLLGKDPKPHAEKAAELKSILRERWYDPATGLWANGTQAAQAVALGLELVPEGDEQKVADRLARMIRTNGHSLDFGMLGSKLIPAMLTKYGYVEDACKMILNPEAPSWANWIHTGLTTLPETWVMDKDFKDASLNHSFLGDVAAWMTNTIAGINCDRNDPGFRHIVFRPHFIEALDWAEGEYRSVRGLIRSEWKREGKKIRLTVTVPANTTATLYLDGKTELGPGTHSFTVEGK